VSRVHFFLGEKTVEGKVTEKVKAKEKYEDAIAAGNAALLVEESEKDKDLLKMTIGGIQPMQEVTVKIQIIKKIEIEAGAYALRIPTSYFIKFGNEKIGINQGIKEADLEDNEAKYSFRITLNTQHLLTYVSMPPHAKVVKITE